MNTELPDDFFPLLESLVAIGAPTGKEARRADFIVDWLSRHGAGERVGRDAIDNVWIDLSDGDSACRLIDSHTDIVFDDEQPPLRKEPERWHAPGILDNTTACALNLVLARSLLQRKSPVPLILSFTVGEEGEGDLCGIRKLVADIGDRLRDAVMLESNLGRCTHQAVGSVRYRVRFNTVGGHSWGDFGRPSALHECARFIMRIEQLMPWKPQHTSMNVGSVRGGTTINTIAAEAEANFDFRSIEPANLETIKQSVPSMLADMERVTKGLKIDCALIGERPAGGIARDHPLTVETLRYQKEMGFEPEFVISSTNANASLAAGIPSICIGIAEGSGCHTRAEYLDLNSVLPGWRYLQKFVP